MGKIKQHYHWVIALIVFVETIIFAGFFNSFSAFTVPITESLDLSRGAYSLSVTARSVFGFVSTLCTGYLFYHFGYRKSAIFCLFLGAGSLIIMAFSKTLAMLTVSSSLMGLACGVCTTAGVVRIVKSWFKKHQGLMLGVISMATGIGGSLMTTMLTEIMVLSNWQYAFIFAALLMIVVAISYFALRDEPSQMGLAPYGDNLTVQNVTKADAKHLEWAGHTFKELLRLPQFYLMILCTLLSCTCVYLTFMVFTPHFQDNGFSQTEASGYYSILMLILSVSKLFGGWLLDKIDAKRVTVICMICAAISQWLLCDVSNPIITYFAMILHAFSLLCTTITIPMLAMTLFGYQSYGSTTGIFLSLVSLASMLATPISNLFYDLLGSYVPVFQVAAILDLVTLGLYLLLYFLSDKEKKKWLSEHEQS